MKKLLILLLISSLNSNLIYSDRIAKIGNIEVMGGEFPDTINYRTRGGEWTGVPDSMTIFTKRGNEVATNGKLFVAVGEGSVNTIAYSSNGINWIGLGTFIFSRSGNTVNWTGNEFIARGNGITATSNDGINWQRS